MVKSFHSFAIRAFKDGITWNNKGEDFANVFPAMAGASYKKRSVDSVASGRRSSRTAMLSQIGGAGPELKKAPVKEEATSKPAATTSKPAASSALYKAAAKNVEPVVKKEKLPKKELVNGHWYIENHKTGTLEFDDVDINTGFFVINCETTNIIVKGKFKNIIVESSKNCAIVLDVRKNAHNN